MISWVPSLHGGHWPHDSMAKKRDKGEKKKEEEVKEENYYRAERSYGSFLRTLELPRDVRADQIKASFKNGILEVRMPKTEEAKAKEIKVKVE